MCIIDPIVRSELMEQVPHLAVYCQDNTDLYEDAVPKYILPMVVRYLNDPNNQVSVVPNWHDITHISLMNKFYRSWKMFWISLEKYDRIFQFNSSKYIFPFLL